MTRTRLTCSKCHRGIAAVAATIAGMPLGPKCAKRVAQELQTTPLEFVAVTAAARAGRAREAEFQARQIPLIEAA